MGAVGFDKIIPTISELFSSFFYIHKTQHMLFGCVLSSVQFTLVNIHFKTLYKIMRSRHLVEIVFTARQYI